MRAQVTEAKQDKVTETIEMGQFRYLDFTWMWCDDEIKKKERGMKLLMRVDMKSADDVQADLD